MEFSSGGRGYSLAKIASGEIYEFFSLKDWQKRRFEAFTNSTFIFFSFSLVERSVMSLKLSFQNSEVLLFDHQFKNEGTIIF